LALPYNEDFIAEEAEDFEITTVSDYLPQRLLATEHTEDTENEDNSFRQGEKFIKSCGKFFNIMGLAFPYNEDLPAHRF
jgi:hypothetical protein